MELYFVAIMIVGVGVFALVFFRRGRDEYRDLLREQALKRHGKLKGGFFGSPKLVFNHKGHNITLYSSRGGGRGHVAFTCAKSFFRFTIDGKLTVGREPPLARLSKWLGMQDIQIGNSEFDDAFLIKADEESFARRFLTPEVQQQLLSIPNSTLQIKPGELILYIWHFLHDTAGFDNFIDTVVLLLENAKRLRLKGDFIPPRPKSVTMVCWILIVAGAGSLLISAASIVVSIIDPIHKELMAKSLPPSIIQDVMMCTGGLVMLVTGVAMRRRQNWARLLYVGWSIISLIIGVSISPMKGQMIPSLIFFLVIVFFLFLPKANMYFKATEVA